MQRCHDRDWRARHDIEMKGFYTDTWVSQVSMKCVYTCERLKTILFLLISLRWDYCKDSLESITTLKVNEQLYIRIIIEDKDKNKMLYNARTQVGRTGEIYHMLHVRTCCIFFLAANAFCIKRIFLFNIWQTL